MKETNYLSKKKKKKWKKKTKLKHTLFFRDKKKRTRMWQSLSHSLRYSWVSPWVPQARTGAWKLRTHTHPRLYWFLGLPEIAIAVLVRTRTWDVMKPQQSPTGCTTPVGGNSNTHLITLSLNSNTLRELNIMTIKLSNKKKTHLFPYLWKPNEKL